MGTDQTDDELSTNPNALNVTFDGDIDYVQEIIITIVATTDMKLPPKPVKLSVMACVRNGTMFTKSVLESSELMFISAANIILFLYYI